MQTLEKVCAIVAHTKYETLGGKYFDLKRAMIFDLGHRLSKHKTTRYARNSGGVLAPLAPPGYAYGMRM